MKGVARFFRDAILPKHCLSCLRLGSFICSSCESKLQPVKRDVCPYCRRESYFGLTHPGCKRRYGLDGIKSFWTYNRQLRRIVKAAKYRLSYKALQELLYVLGISQSESIVTYMCGVKTDCLISVPIHTSKMRKRGFNQSTTICDFFSRSFHIPSSHDFLKRVINNKPQARCKTAAERVGNVRGVFKVTKKGQKYVCGRTLTVVDDVITSGSTVKELARTLKRNGAKRVFTMTIAGL